MFIFGSSAVVGAATGVGQDSWIALVSAALVSVPMVLIYARIIKLNPGEGLFVAVERLLGKVIGKVVIALMSWYALHLCSLILRNFSEYLQVTSMLETPQLPMLIIMVITIYFLARNGGKALGKWALATIPIVLGIVALTVFLSFNVMDPSNFRPFFEHPIDEIANTAFQTFSFPFAETVLLLGIADFIRPSDNLRRIYLTGILIGFVVLMAIVTRNLMVLGPAVVSAEYFPSYAAVRIIHVGEFLSRIEGSISVNFILAGITKSTLCLITATRGIACLFGIRDWRKLVAPVGLLAVMLAQILYGSTMEMFGFIKYYPYYAFPFQVALPLVIWIVSEIRARKARKAGGATGLQPASRPGE